MELRAGLILLFLDLDEILVTRTGQKKGVRCESLAAIHPQAAIDLSPLAGQVIVLTHRSRFEAMQIVKAINGLEAIILGVAAADDLIRTALATRQIMSLLHRGIEKRLFVRTASQKYGVPLNRIAILDDLHSNIASLLGDGAGMGIHAPHPVIREGKVFTYDLQSAVSALLSFQENATSQPRWISLPACREYPLSALPQTTIVKDRKIAFMRRLANFLRVSFSDAH